MRWLKLAFAEMFRLLRRDSFAISFYGWRDADRCRQAYRLRVPRCRIPRVSVALRLDG